MNKQPGSTFSTTINGSGSCYISVKRFELPSVEKILGGTIDIEIKSAIVIPTIRGECVTHRNCSQLFHTCLQHNIGSCRYGEFRDGEG